MDEEAMKEQIQRVQDIERKADIFLGEEVNTISYHDYEKILVDSEVREKLAITLM